MLLKSSKLAANCLLRCSDKVLKKENGGQIKKKNKNQIEVVCRTYMTKIFPNYTLLLLLRAAQQPERKREKT